MGTVILELSPALKRAMKRSNLKCKAVNHNVLGYTAVQFSSSLRVTFSALQRHENLLPKYSKFFKNSHFVILSVLEVNNSNKILAPRFLTVFITGQILRILGEGQGLKAGFRYLPKLEL